eukprot:CAMPEP_0181201792 /NCGR_PEP_ID=MMETSP1096-20121128/18491_1 /TAXON_ID=156174 ORGANISM="Chrysochromulina ericina, Strain CCMP281" /NCGR_SAMPLE_ID=MMETSP1096 /ASSEMBLY_ACC=CAM_ASM_000453 /LENGTH=81 /DNA_ID=CAMNT_0023292249 /DNA_START=1212 /DNA_END=1457 /DNA_ORIENTATION=+
MRCNFGGGRAVLVSRVGDFSECRAVGFWRAWGARSRPGGCVFVRRAQSHLRKLPHGAAGAKNHPLFVPSKAKPHQERHPDK